MLKLHNAAVLRLWQPKEPCLEWFQASKSFFPPSLAHRKGREACFQFLVVNHVCLFTCIFSAMQLQGLRKLCYLSNSLQSQVKTDGMGPPTKSPDLSLTHLRVGSNFLLIDSRKSSDSMDISISMICYKSAPLCASGENWRNQTLRWWLLHCNLQVTGIDLMDGLVNGGNNEGHTEEIKGNLNCFEVAGCIG